MLANTHPEVVIPVVRHHDHNLIIVSERGHQLGNVPTTAAIVHNGDLIPNTIGATGNVDPFDGYERLTALGSRFGLIVC